MAVGTTLTGCGGWISIPTAQEGKCGIAAGTAFVHPYAWNADINTEIRPDDHFGDVTNCRRKAKGMSSLRGSCRARVDIAAIPDLACYFIEHDAGSTGFALLMDRTANKNISFTGLLARTSFSIRKGEPIEIGMDFVANGTVAADATLNPAAYAYSAGATAFGTTAYMTVGASGPQVDTTFKCDEMDFEVTRDIMPDDYFESASPINWRKFVGGMYHLTGRASGPLITTPVFSLGTAGTVHTISDGSFVIKLIDNDTDGQYTFTGVIGTISYGLDKAGRATCSLAFESTYDGTNEVAIQQPAAA